MFVHIDFSKASLHDPSTYDHDHSNDNKFGNAIMHYDTLKNEHGLPHDPFKAIVTPRPIGWVGSKAIDGTLNLAPYSYFNAVADRPYYVTIGSNGLKDTMANIEETGVFTVSLATEALFDHMNGSSVASGPEIDEFALTGATPQMGKFVDAPFVAESPAAFECKLYQIIDLPGANRDKKTGNFVILAQVVGTYINDDFITDGRFDTRKARPLARCGYMDYAVIGSENMFETNRPELDEHGRLKAPEKWDGTYR